MCDGYRGIVATGNYLWDNIYVIYELSAQEIHQKDAMFLITTSFTLVAVLQLSILCMWIKTLNSLLFARHYLSHTVSIFFSSFNVVATMESSQFDYRNHFYDMLILFVCNLSNFLCLDIVNEIVYHHFRENIMNLWTRM